MVKWLEKFEHAAGVINKGLGVYNTIKGIYQVGQAVAPYVAAMI